MCFLWDVQDDEADDSDRLVIDEGDQYSNSELIQALAGKLEELHENELPECQGCKKREAQFVCADCKRQWYCSRECQVNDTFLINFTIQTTNKNVIKRFDALTPILYFVIGNCLG